MCSLQTKGTLHEQVLFNTLSHLTLNYFFLLSMTGIFSDCETMGNLGQSNSCLLSCNDWLEIKVEINSDCAMSKD